MLAASHHNAHLIQELLDFLGVDRAIELFEAETHHKSGRMNAVDVAWNSSGTCAQIMEAAGAKRAQPTRRGKGGWFAHQDRGAYAKLNPSKRHKGLGP